MDDSLVAPSNRLKIGKCNLRLSSDLKSKEATLQVVYDVLKLTPFYKAFQASADVPEIYMQEFWATASEKLPRPYKDKRVKQTGKMTGSGKQKQPATGLETLSEITLTETEQLKIAIKRSRIQTHNSISGSGDGVEHHVIGSLMSKYTLSRKIGTDEGAGDKPEVLDVPEHHSNSEEESQTFSDDDDDDVNKDLDAHDDDDDDATKLDDDGDNITHPKFSTFSTDDQEEQDDEERNKRDDEDEEEISDQLVRTPSDYQTPDESEKQKDDDRVKDGEEDKEGDVTNVNLEGGDVDMTDADTTKDIASLPCGNSQAANPKIFKDQVKTQTSKIKSKVEKYVTESLGAEVLIRSTNQPQTSYRIASSLSELELKGFNGLKWRRINPFTYHITREDKDKDEEPSVGSNRGTKRWRSGKEAESSKEPTRKESRTTNSSKGAPISQPTDLNETTHLEFIIGNDDVIPTREVQDERQWHPPTSTTLDHEWHLTKNHVSDILPPQTIG
ncbi:hypothetical protein Tco_0513967 [Tanacetum coccineum]